MEKYGGLTTRSEQYTAAVGGDDVVVVADLAIQRYRYTTAPDPKLRNSKPNAKSHWQLRSNDMEILRSRSGTTRKKWGRIGHMDGSATRLGLVAAAVAVVVERREHW